MQGPKLEPDTTSWIEEMQRCNMLMAQLVRQQRDWKLSLRNGMLAGLGAAIGATILVSLIIWILQPLKGIEFLKPTLERIDRNLESGTQR